MCNTKQNSINCDTSKGGNTTYNNNIFEFDESDRDKSQLQTPQDIIVADLVCGKEVHRGQSKMPRKETIDVNDSFYPDACANQ